MIIVKKEKSEVLSISTQEVKLDKLGALSSELAQKIIKTIAEKPDYASNIAKRLKENEQKVYYHIRRLEKAGFITVLEKKELLGATAKVYKLKNKSFFFKFSNFEETSKILQVRNKSTFLEDFFNNGELNAQIIVGSPDPHGPERARSRDGYYGIDFALFLGTFLNYVPDIRVKLDTEVREEDLKKNLIIIGGPIVNKITERINENLPIMFKKEIGWNIYSKISNKKYVEEETGLIVKTKNPFNKSKKILLIAGKRYSGTRAAITAMLKHFKEVKEGNNYNKKIKAKVVLGIDLNSDGIIDDVEFLE